MVRHGTHPAPGHREYMPHYTKERMTDQQVEDLERYILERAWERELRSVGVSESEGEEE